MKITEFCGADLYIPPEWDRDFVQVVTDSRDVNKGDLFIARAGGTEHGAAYAEAAAAAGAVAILEQGETRFRCIWHTDSQTGDVLSVPVFTAPDIAEQLPQWLYRRYQAAEGMQLIGITGTNGKTSCAQYVAQLSSALGEPCGLIGTVGNGVWPELQPTRNTTPDLATVLRLLEQMQQAGAKRVVMEVSSHGLHQGRVAGLTFDAVLLTNLTQDHLDYHGDMESYFQTKRSLFVDYGAPLALVNADDEYGRRLLTDSALGVDHCIGFGSARSDQAEVAYCIDALSSEGIEARLTSLWGTAELSLPLIGEFNLSNSIAALSVLAALGLPFEELIAAAGHLQPVSGRMELFGHSEQRPAAIVDFAHTPDALETVLSALKPWNRPISLVYGCGGERDRSKRAIMTAVGLRHADRIWLTDDNPRREEPEQIFADALDVQGASVIKPIHDRETAIRMAVEHTPVNGLLVVAGKGHESYQDIGGVKHPYSDIKVLQGLGYRRLGQASAVKEGTAHGGVQ
jgi:UDP-N-acetylmuramoyl-L-alanyl-D-glutamate--2,6-diaminopimelate ligase